MTSQGFMVGLRPPKYLYLAHRASQNAIAGPKGQPKIVGLMVQPQLTGYTSRGAIFLFAQRQKTFGWNDTLITEALLSRNEPKCR